MSSTPRHPTRLSVYTSDGVYYPREITEADGKLYLIDDDGSVVELNKTAVTKITDAAGTAIGSVDPTTGGTVAIPNASTTKRGLVVFGTSTGKAPGTASAGFYFCPILLAIALAASSRQGAKLGQSLKSIIRIEPSAITTASPP